MFHPFGSNDHIDIGRSNRLGGPIVDRKPADHTPRNLLLFQGLDQTHDVVAAARSEIKPAWPC